VVVSGSDVFQEWTESEIENVFVHAWPYDFGWEPNPWPGDLALKYLQGTRRELLFLNKNPMTQVVDPSELAEGTYLVDEETDRVLFYPPVGVDLEEALVEISVRPEALYGADSKLLRVFRVNNVMLQNLVFEHAAAGSLANDATIAFRGCSNVVIEDVTIRWSNGFGLSMGGQGDTPAENFIVRNFRSIGSGALAMDGGGLSNSLFDGGEIRQTNWRGALWGATGWAPCGFKFASYYGMHMRDFTISQTHASGVWMDTDNIDILFERVYSVNNYRSGFSLEGNKGPITIRDSIIFGNSTGINGFDNSGVIVENTLIVNNGERQVRFAGSHPLSEEELLEFDAGWSRERQRMRHIPRDWALLGNLIGSTDNAVSQDVFDFGLRSGSFTDGDGNPVFQVFADTYTGSDNEFSLPGGQSASGFPTLTNGPATFPQWVNLVGEQNATWVSTESLEMALTEAEAVVGEEATGFAGLAAAVAVVTVEVEAGVAREDGTVPAVLRISREGGDLSQPLLVTYTLGGTAIEGVDYAELDGGLLLATDQTSGTIEITPVADGVPEFEETVDFQISADIDGSYRLGNPSSVTVRVADKDSVVPASLAGELGIGSEDTERVIEVSNPSAGPMTLRVGSLSMDYQVLEAGQAGLYERSWTDIESSGSAVTFNWIAANNDGLSNRIPLGFDFPYYGDVFDGVYIHSNGFVTFTEPEDPSWRFTFLKELPETEDMPAETMVAPFWSNLALDSQSRVTTQAGNGVFRVQFTDLYRSGVFGAPQRVTFQVVLYATGEIQFLYSKNDYTSNSRSIGIQGAGKTAGLSLSAEAGIAASGTGVRLVPPAAWLSTGESSLVLAGSGSATLSLHYHPGSVGPGSYAFTLPLVDDSTGTSLFSVPVSLEVATRNDLIADSWNLGSYRWSDWFGTFSAEDLPWIYHYGPPASLGWLYAFSTGTDGMWLYHLDSEDWVWTSEFWYPWIYSPASGWFWAGS
jgi:hypothetical protein